MEFDMPRSKVYALTDEQGRITRIDGGYTMGNIQDEDAWTLIDEGDGDRFNLCQSNYLESPMYTEDGIPRWKLKSGAAVLRTETEIAQDRASLPKPEHEPTMQELAAENKRLAAQLAASIEANANLEECLVEMAEIVYA